MDNMQLPLAPLGCGALSHEVCHNDSQYTVYVYVLLAWDALDKGIK